VEAIETITAIGKEYGIPAAVLREALQKH